MDLAAVKKQATPGMSGELMNGPEVVALPISALDPCHLAAHVSRCLIGKQAFKGLPGPAPTQGPGLLMFNCHVRGPTSSWVDLGVL